MKQILNKCKGEKNMEEKKVLDALRELRDSLYNSLSEDEKREADEREAEYGARQIADMVSKMEIPSAYCVLASFVEKNPKLVLDVRGFCDFLEKSFDVFGADKTAKMCAKAIPMIEKDLKKNVDKEMANFEREKLNEMNTNSKNKTEEEPRRPKTFEEEIAEIKELLKNKNVDIEVIGIEEVEGDD
jgi:hypothetical protein